ncbi:hypothetical protein FTO70_12180 [Methanosarcina sp. KYL-1]|uniref:hypothetical protein n=1 Tax=Methanosarcina sp. KYL-1 TaxID=2602068 RepID=UPI00210142CC|nr:hypothetical protein [Methanosarcina sp. KYL-1]MCQ1536417.1 hypothetical protein [Methanosarcina sp. KYL-1]
MKKFIVMILFLVILTAGCTEQDNAPEEDAVSAPEISETKDSAENASAANGEQIEINPALGAPGAEADFTEAEVLKSEDEGVENSDAEISGTEGLEAFSTKTTVKLNGDIGQKIGSSYLGINEGQVYHFFPEQILGDPRYTTIKVEDGLHVLHPDGLFFLENDTATIYSNTIVEEAAFPCEWNPPIQKPNPTGGLYNFYFPYMTANFTESEYWIEDNRIYAPKKGHIFLYRNGETVYIKNGTGLEDNGCYFTLATENVISDQVVFDRYVILKNVSLVRHEGKTNLPALFEN